MTGDRVRQIVRSLIDKGYLLRYTSEINVNETGNKRKVRVFDWKPTIAKIKNFTNSPEILTFVTKRKHKCKKNMLQSR